MEKSRLLFLGQYAIPQILSFAIHDVLPRYIMKVDYETRCFCMIHITYSKWGKLTILAFALPLAILIFCVTGKSFAVDSLIINANPEYFVDALSMYDFIEKKDIKDSSKLLIYEVEETYFVGNVIRFSIEFKSKVPEYYVATHFGNNYDETNVDHFESKALFLSCDILNSECIESHAWINSNVNDVVNTFTMFLDSCEYEVMEISLSIRIYDIEREQLDEKVISFQVEQTSGAEIYTFDPVEMDDSTILDNLQIAVSPTEIVLFFTPKGTATHKSIQVDPITADGEIMWAYGFEYTETSGDKVRVTATDHSLMSDHVVAYSIDRQKILRLNLKTNDSQLRY